MSDDNDRNNRASKAYQQSEALKSLRQKIKKLSTECFDDPSVDNEEQTVPRHIALLFITIADLHHEAIWKAFLEDSSASDELVVSVYVHAKFPQRVRSQWLREHLLSTKSHRPDWGSVRFHLFFLLSLSPNFLFSSRCDTKPPNEEG